MRSIWRGAVSFGLVSIGVKLYSATEDKDIRFHQVHATDGGRVKYKRVCSIDGEEVEYSDIAKGYELPDGQVVILTDEDFDQMPLSTRREIDVLQFVDQDEIDPIQFEKTYYLEPDGPATRPYVLLRDALENAGQVAITKIAIRQRESLAAVLPVYREFATRGQIEIATTPFYHPILPLLWDKRLARQAMPHVNLPEFLDSYQEDAEGHVRRAIEYHTKIFGEKPRCMWPSEGSVAQALDDQARFYRERGRPMEAVAASRRAVAMRRSSVASSRSRTGVHGLTRSTYSVSLRQMFPIPATAR